MTAEPARPLRGPGSAGIDFEELVRGAIRLGERDGFEALSMRRLAAELQVGVMTIYRYVRTKQELLDAIVDWYLGQRLDIVTTGDSWDDEVVSVFRSVHELMLSEPVLAHAIVAQPFDVKGAYRLAEAALSPLRRAGLSDGDAVDLFRHLHSYTLGFTLYKIAHSGSDVPGVEDRPTLLRRLPADAFPNLLAVADDWGTWNPPELFEHGLRLLLEPHASDGSSDIRSRGR